MFEYFSNNTIFSYGIKQPNNATQTNKSLQDLQIDSTKIAYALQSMSQHKIGLFLDDTYHFIACLFGTLLAHKEAYLLNSPNNISNDMFLLDDNVCAKNLKSNNLKEGGGQGREFI